MCWNIPCTLVGVASDFHNVQETPVKYNPLDILCKNVSCSSLKNGSASVSENLQRKESGVVYQEQFQ